MIDLMLPGGEMKKGIDPLEGAKQFIEKYYPNLDSQSVIFKSDHDMPMPMLDEKTLDELISKKESQNKDDGDVKYLQDMKVRMTGQTNEINVTDMLHRSFREMKPMVFITQFKWESFRKLFTPASGKDQEIDDVIIIGEFSTVIILEIKSSGSFSPSMTKSLNRKNEI